MTQISICSDTLVGYSIILCIYLLDIAFNFDTRTLTSSTPYYSEWTQITPQVVSSCVDMVFLVDRTASLSSYLPGITNVAKYLPENGDGCVNR